MTDILFLKNKIPKMEFFFNFYCFFLVFLYNTKYYLFNFLFMVIVKKAIESEAQIQKISKLLENLEIKYKNPSFYILAFIHRSIVNEKPDFTPEHNERLEFLWDAVLELVITENLFKNFPEKTEWELTDIRSAIVRGKNLAKIAKNLGFASFLLLGKWEEKSGWRDNEYLLANVVEAFIWAIYIDLWLEESKIFIDKYIYSSISEILEANSIKEYKTLIQELIQAKMDITPTYNVLAESWADHEKIFTVWIYFKDELIEKWVWSSKKKAQEDAAKNAYLKITYQK